MEIGAPDLGFATRIWESHTGYGDRKSDTANGHSEMAVEISIRELQMPTWPWKSGYGS